MDKLKYSSGDIGFSRGFGLISKLILFFMSMQTGAAHFSHAYAHINGPEIVEAVHKIKINSASKYRNQEIMVYRFPLSEIERRLFDFGARKISGGAYGWTKLPLFALDAIATFVMALFGRPDPIFFFTKTFGIFNIPVCSQLVVYLLIHYTDYRLKNKSGQIVGWREVSPDYLHDLLKLPINRATLIRAQSSPLRITA